MVKRSEGDRMLYNLLKFLHIVGVIAWIGATVTIGVLNARFARHEERAARLAMVRQTPAAAAFIMMPGGVLALVAGIGMTITARTGMPLWIDWGVLALVVSAVLGATVLRRTGEALAARIAAGVNDTRALERRLALWSSFNLLLLLSAAWAMVFKPAL
jgi:uncharacterized membrane protein